jgi:cephalosporin-C deacetylase-like acetyl esterase
MIEPLLWFNLMETHMKIIYKRILAGLGLLSLVVGSYYLLVAKLPIEQLAIEQINAKYQYQSSFSDFDITDELLESREFTFTAYDGEKVFGQIMLPSVTKEKYPVLIGIHAMGRSYPRWFKDSLKGRPTVTSVNKITNLALDKGYAVVAIDARFHGKRKVADNPLTKIWNNMQFFGDKTDYENMILKTVIDNRTLLDWIETQNYLDAEDTSVAGYTMGGQASLILAAVDNRIDDVITIVPPFINNTIAAVSPYNLAHQIDDGRVLFIYGEKDDVASPEENEIVFNAISTKDKKLLGYDADHILPENYVNAVGAWLR